jgi:choline dehydrogenase
LTGEYQLGLGPLTNNGADYLGWEKIPENVRCNFSPSTQQALSKFPADWPEVEVCLLPFQPSLAALLMLTFTFQYFSSPAFVGNFSSLTADQPTDGYQYATILTALVAPLSRGSVTISSADTSVLPVINPGWLTSTADQEVAVAAYKRARAAFSTTAMKPVLVGNEYYPGSSVQTDAQILATIRKDAMTVWHASCTCAMGTSNNPAAVIDSHARVYGVENLRVVDASSFPLLPPGHPQSTICKCSIQTDAKRTCLMTFVDALAEKIADLINNGQ